MIAQPPSTGATGRRVGIIAILLLAFALRCFGLDFQELRGDEAFGYFFSLPSLGDIVEQTLELDEPHPVASYWLQHLWLGLAGDSEYALRFAGIWWSLLAVALTVPLAVQLGLSSTSGTLSALLMAISPYLIWHAQDARMYNMSLALTMLSTLLALTWWRTDGNIRRGWIAVAYLAVTWFSLQTHYFALYIVVAQDIAVAGWGIVEHAWRKLLLWFGIGVLLLLAWLPWLLAAWGTITNYHGNGDSPSVIDALVRAHSAFGVGEALPSELRSWWALLTLAAVALGILALWRSPQRGSRTSLWFLLVYWLIPLAATWISAQSRPIFNERYLVAIVPPVYLLMSAALNDQQAIGNRGWLQWLGRVTLAFVIVGMALGATRQMIDPQYSKTRGWRELATTLEALTTGVDASYVRLVQNYPDPTVWYYYRGNVPHLVLPPVPNDQALAESEVARLVESGVGRVLLVEQPSDAWDGAGIAQAALSSDFVMAGETNGARWPVSIWVRPTAGFEPLQVDYEDGLSLTGAYITPTVLTPSGVVDLFLRWQGDPTRVTGQIAVSAQILNSNGELVAQQDRPLEIASLNTAPVVTYAILLPAELAAGDYRLIVAVYDPSQEGAPRRMITTGEDSYTLAPLTVVERANE